MQYLTIPVGPRHDCGARTGQPCPAQYLAIRSACPRAWSVSGGARGANRSRSSATSTRFSPSPANARSGKLVKALCGFGEVLLLQARVQTPGEAD
jgi:hypothetical protein